MVARLLLAAVEAYALGYVATAERAVLQSLAAHLTAADVTAGQEDDLRLETGGQDSQSSRGFIKTYSM